MLSGFKKKIKDESTSLREVYLEVNPYLHSSRMALQLIAGLNQPTSIDDKQITVFDYLDNIINSDDFENDCNEIFNNYRYTQNIRVDYEQMKIDVTSSNDEDWTKIVLGGEFSAGKSSFLNSLLCDKGEIEFLPVSDKPTSVIPTYIYCSSKQSMQYVIGENKQNGKMLLSLHALLALGHDFERKHNISLGTFLNKLIIQQPIKHDFLNDVVFVVTPGSSKEDGQSKTDRQTAINAVKTGEVLFWLTDIDGGTVKKEDLDFIRDNFEKEKPKVIVFNKADKKSSKEISKIILDAVLILKAKNDDTIIDIVAYSSHDRQILKSYRGNKDWKSVFEKVKSKARKKKAEQDFMESLNEDLEEITKLTASEIKDLDKKIKVCNKQIVDKNNEEDSDISYIKNKITYYRDKSLFIRGICEAFQNIAEDSLNRELEWNKKIGWTESGDSLLRLWKLNMNSFKNLSIRDTEILDIEDGVFEDIDEIQNVINDTLKKKVVEDLISDRNLCKQQKKDLNRNLKKFTELVSLIDFQLIKCIKRLNENKWQSNFDHSSIVGVINSNGDVFNCIIHNNFDGFLACLSKRTEISNLRDNDGHNILSLAVKHKRYEMVSVLLPKANRLIDRKENDNLSALEIAENNHDHLMVNLLKKSSS